MIIKSSGPLILVLLFIPTVFLFSQTLTDNENSLSLLDAQYRKEPLVTAPIEPIVVPNRKERSDSLDKFFDALSHSSLTDKTIGKRVREKHQMWEDSQEEQEYDVKTQGLLTLEKLLERAYEKNPSIKMLQAQLNQSRLDVIAAKSNYFPTIRFDGSISLTSRKLIDAIDISTSQFGSFPKTVTQSAPISTQVSNGSVRIFDGTPQTFFSFRFVLEQPIFTWGKIPMAVEAYKQALEAAELQIAKKKKEVRAEVSIYYQSLYYLEKMAQDIKNARDIMDQLLKITNDSYKTGFIIYTDYLDVQVKSQQLIASTYKIQDNYNQILIKLAACVGLKNISIDMIDYSTIDTQWNPTLLSVEQYYDLALKYNIDLKLLDVLKEANALQAKIAKSSSYLKPDFGIQLSLGTMGPDFPFLQRGWYGHNSTTLIGSLGFKSTIIDGGAILANSLKKNEELNKSLYQIQLGEAQIHAFIASQLSAVELNLKSLEYLRLKTDSDKRQVEQKRIAYQNGGTQIDYMRAQIEFYTNGVDILSEYIGLIKNYYMLLFIVGLL